MLMSMISTSYVAHYNAPKFWNELQNATVQRYNWVVSGAFAIAILSYVVIMSMGFLTFGGNSAGFILNNYSQNDGLATVARLAVGIGIVCSYPFTFAALRDGLAEAVGISEDAKERVYFHYMNLCMFIVITSLTTRLRNVGTVVSFSGSMIGSLFIYVIPALMNIGSYHKLKLMDENRQVSTTNWLDRVELCGNYCMAIFGIMLGVLGVIVNIQSLQL
jgi:amino acid permease